jgi:hypothetical protein
MAAHHLAQAAGIAGVGGHRPLLFAVSDAEFDEITGYLVPPAADEGFKTTVYSDAESRS